MISAEQFKTCLRVRNKVQEFAYKHRHIGCPKTLECYCAIASYALKHTLGSETTDLVVGTYDDNDHCWVVLKEQELVVDITATQFGVYSNQGVFVVPNKVDFYVSKRINPSSSFFVNWHYQSPYHGEHHEELKQLILELRGTVNEQTSNN